MIQLGITNGGFMDGDGAPGERINVSQDDVRIIRASGDCFGHGTTVEVIRGPHKGKRGYIYAMGYLNDIAVRVGKRADWDRHDAQTQRMIADYMRRVNAE